MAATKAQIKERKNGDEADRSGNGSLLRSDRMDVGAGLHPLFFKEINEGRVGFGSVQPRRVFDLGL
jgi:hypothetical protein